MKHIIMATAGHVDHGKTSLVLALTGIDCDTRQEEKRRGLTIDLGFAHLELPPRVSIGIIDVPGHRDFVHTMVAGMGGVDVALLVVAADSGVMPQTVEHLEIMSMLGIQTGLVALTRVDLVDEEMATLATEDVRDFLQGTFLDGCPVIPVSSRTGVGIDQIKEALKRISATLPDRPCRGAFRMFADRTFTAQGFGTVFTGSVLGGRLRVGQDAWVLPVPGQACRVRRLERHHGEVSEIVAGDRAAINLTRVKCGSLRHGMLIADRPLRDTRILDAHIRLGHLGRSLKRCTNLKFHLGAWEGMAKLSLLGRDQLQEGETSFVRIRLTSPCIACFADRFVLRDPSTHRTVGGGTVLDIAPARRRGRRLIAALEQVSRTGLPGLVAAHVCRHDAPLNAVELAERLNFPRDEFIESVIPSLPENTVHYADADGVWLLTRQLNQVLQESIIQALGEFHSGHPLLETGMTAAELGPVLGLQHGSNTRRVLPLILKAMTVAGKLVQRDHTWALATHTVILDPEMCEAVTVSETILRESGMRAVSMAVFREACENRAVSIADEQGALDYLVATGHAYRADGHYLHASVVDRCREILFQLFAECPSGMRPADFRDRIQGNRKVALLLLTLFDSEKLTRRSGEERVLTDTGRAYMQEHRANET